MSYPLKKGTGQVSGDYFESQNLKPVKTSHYLKVPQVLMANKIITKAMFNIYIFIKIKADKKGIYEGRQKDMAQGANIALKTASNAILKLQEIKLVIRDKQAHYQLTDVATLINDKIFIRWPYDAVCNPKLSKTMIDVLLVLSRHTDKYGRCFINQETIAQKLDIYRQSVNRIINKLVKLDLVQTEDTRTKGKCGGICNYLVLFTNKATFLNDDVRHQKPKRTTDLETQNTHNDHALCAISETTPTLKMSNQWFNTTIYTTRHPIKKPVEEQQQAPNKAEQPTEQAIAHQIIEWRKIINVLPDAIPQDGVKLVQNAFSFLDSPLASDAVRLGWTDLELFGVYHGALQAIEEHRDAMGLIPSIAWSQVRGNLSGLETVLVGLTKTEALLEVRYRGEASGMKFSRPRKLVNDKKSVLFWDRLGNI